MSNIIRINNEISQRRAEEIVKRNFIMSLSVHNEEHSLLDYEIYFRENYIVRFNSVKADYEVLRVYNTEDGNNEVWIPLSRDELFNDLIRGRAKSQGKLTEREVDLMLSDRRIVPEYNPFLNYFNSLSFDESHLGSIDNLASYVTVNGGEVEQQRWKTNFKKAIVRTVKCALNDNYFNKQCLVLYSANQSVGKTSFLRALTPPTLNNYFFEEMISNDKDSQIMLSNNFIILLDELATLSRLDINHLKSILSKREVNVRLPYERKAKIFPRRASFFGTTNRTDFLMDSQNVRWIVFNVEDIDKSYGDIFTGKFNIDINKVWSEAYHLLKTGFQCELTKEDLEINEINNQLYSSNSIEKDLIEEYFLPATPEDKDKSGYRRSNSTGIYETLLDLLERDDRLKVAEKINSKILFLELKRIAGWEKKAIRESDTKVYSGYHYFIKKEMRDDELF
jgi:predicted P-loop ATPase